MNTFISKLMFIDNLSRLTTEAVVFDMQMNIEQIRSATKDRDAIIRCLNKTVGELQVVPNWWKDREIVSEILGEFLSSLVDDIADASGLPRSELANPSCVHGITTTLQPIIDEAMTALVGEAN